MINLNFILLEKPIKIEDATFLIIQDKKVYSNLISSLYMFNSQNYLSLFDNQYKVIKNTEMMVVSDIFGFSMSNPTVQKNIYKEIQGQLNEDIEMKSKIEKLSFEITDLISTSLLSHELNLEYDEITIMELLSALGVKIEQHNDNIVLKLEDIIAIYKYLGNKKILVFNNIGLYLDHEGWLSVIEYINLNHLDVLFIETDNNEFSNRYVLDSDYYLEAYTN